MDVFSRTFFDEHSPHPLLSSPHSHHEHVTFTMPTDAMAVNASPIPADAPSTASASARYSPLPRDGDSFRLLRVLPNRKTSSPLQCELYTTSISREENEYIAGSYVWGPPEPTKSILLDSKPFQVRQNLFRFLKAFRSRYRSQVIWLDAVCINQNDVQERGHQVQEMKRIYSGAKCVYCWLGYDKPMPHTSISDQQHIVDMYYWCKGDERQYTRRKNQLEYIVQAEYWSRMWIVQEFILARKVVLLVGTDRISYEQLYSITRYRPLFKGSDILSQSKTHSLMNYRQTPRRFEALFEQFGMLPCSIPQDGVFALLGLVGSRAEELELVGMIDYSLTVWQLLQRILAPNILERGPFRFTEQYNRFVIRGQEDKYMRGPIKVKLGQSPQWELCGPDNSRYSSFGGSSLHMAMAIRASRAMTYTELTDTHMTEISMYAPKWRATSKQSGVSVCLSRGFHPLSKNLERSSTCVLIEGCDSRCTTTCVTHTILGFAWRFYHEYEHASGPAPTTAIDVPKLARSASSNVSELIYNMQQGSMEMVEAVSHKVRVGVVEHHIGGLPQYGFETDLETMVKLSIFVMDLERSEAWTEFQGMIMERWRCQTLDKTLQAWEKKLQVWDSMLNGTALEEHMP